MANANFVASTANAAASITLTNNGLIERGITNISYSYSAVPTGGSIKVEDGAGTTIALWYVVAGGPGHIPLPATLHGTLGNNLIITIAAGGTGVIGTLLVT